MTTIIDYKETYASGGRKGWAKLVTGVDMSSRGGYALMGYWLKEGENSLPIGGIVAICTHEGSVKNGWKAVSLFTVKENELEPILNSNGEALCFDLAKRGESLKKYLSEKLSQSVEEINPLAAFSDAELRAEFKRRGTKIFLPHDYEGDGSIS